MSARLPFLLTILILSSSIYFSCSKKGSGVSAATKDSTNTVQPKAGCTDKNAFNYDPAAVKDNGTCDYDSINYYEGNFKIYITGYSTASLDANLEASVYQNTILHDSCTYTSVENNDTVNLAGMFCNYGAISGPYLVRAGKSFQYLYQATPRILYINQNYYVRMVSVDTFSLTSNFSVPGDPQTSGIPGEVWDWSYSGIAVRQK